MPIRHFGAYISIHAPAWGATKTCSKAGQPAGISIHAPAWGATRTVLPDLVPGIISIHAPAWGATGLRLCCFRRRLIISIHAPAWGATMKCNGGIDFVSISIHAPAWGATLQAFFLPNGCIISIHAPAWGATMIYLILLSFWTFQSTHPRGVRRSTADQKPPAYPFQSTHPRGVRLRRELLRRQSYFISIHAPAWGATLRSTWGGYFFAYFNPRTRVGCDYPHIA